MVPKSLKDWIIFCMIMVKFLMLLASLKFIQRHAYGKVAFACYFKMAKVTLFAMSPQTTRIFIFKSSGNHFYSANWKTLKLPEQSPMLLNFLRFVEGTVKNALRLLDIPKPLLIPDIRWFLAMIFLVFTSSWHCHPFDVRPSCLFRVDAEKY